jgi:hypothetical protein
LYLSREGERGGIPNKTGTPPLSSSEISEKERRRKSFLITIGTLLLLLY